MKKMTFDTTIPKTLPLLLKKRAAECADLYLQAAKDKEGKFQYYTYAQCYEEIIALALAFRSLGIERGNNVALISDNRREWLLTDFAISSLGAADVPRGCDSLGNEIRFIISFAECKAGVFENARQLKKVLENISEVPLLKTAILYDAASDEDKKAAEDAGIKVYSFAEVLAKGNELYAEDKAAKKAEIEAEMEKTDENDNATIIFTSGTTGTPKGVMLTHKNYIYQLSVIHNYLPCLPGEWWMTVLPVWHSFERFIQYVPILMKCGLAYSKPVAPILLADFAVIRPQWMCGVPRLWDSLAKGVNRAMAKTGGATYKIFKFFVGAGKAYSRCYDRVHGDICRFKFHSRLLDTIVFFLPMIVLWPWHKLGDALVFKKIRAKFGGRMKIAISGGGALQKDADMFYRAIGLHLLEGYGLTESAPVISFRHYKHPRKGCVGLIFPTMELRVVAEDHGVIKNMAPLPPGKQGLICVRSAQVMKGYYQRPDLTEKVIDKDGWLNTGDLGMKTLDNEIKITGRAKDTIVLLGGENIEPAVIEAGLLVSDYIESAMVVGQDKKFLGVLLVPAKDAVVEYAKGLGVTTENYDELLKSNEIQSLFTKEIADLVSTENGFRSCEKVFKFVVTSESFKVGDELSAKQEMIRYKIAEKYKDLIDTMFSE